MSSEAYSESRERLKAKLKVVEDVCDDMQSRARNFTVKLMALPVMPWAITDDLDDIQKDLRYMLADVRAEPVVPRILTVDYVKLRYDPNYKEYWESRDKRLMIARQRVEASFANLVGAIERGLLVRTEEPELLGGSDAMAELSNRAGGMSGPFSEATIAHIKLLRNHWSLFGQYEEASSTLSESAHRLLACVMEPFDLLDCSLLLRLNDSAPSEEDVPDRPASPSLVVTLDPPVVEYDGWTYEVDDEVAAVFHAVQTNKKGHVSFRQMQLLHPILESQRLDRIKSKMPHPLRQIFITPDNRGSYLDLS